ncbi:MAG: hypothetical protein ABL977_10450 [Candidatus Eisenbacteria bacterium]
MNNLTPSSIVLLLPLFSALVILFAISSHALFERWAKRRGA